MVFLLKVLLILNILYQGKCHPVEQALQKDENLDNKLVYLNVTITHHEPEGNYTLTYDLIPVADSNDFSKVQRDLDEDKQFTQFKNLARQDSVLDVLTSLVSTTPAPFSLSFESFVQRIQRIPSAAVTTVGNLAEEVRELLGVNVTQVRRKPLGSAIQAVNNIAFCNPIFAGFNPGRCKGFLQSTE